MRPETRHCWILRRYLSKVSKNEATRISSRPAMLGERQHGMRDSNDGGTKIGVWHPKTAFVLKMGDVCSME